MRIRIRPCPLFPLSVVISISLLALLMLYSIGAGNFYPWCIKQFCRLLLGIVAIFVASSTPVHFWKKHAYTGYIICVVMLACVAIVGKISMGAQRWLDLYFFNLQPSELMRISLIIALSRYFADLGINSVMRTVSLALPLLMMAVPVFMVLLQPDLGTATILFCTFVAILFVCGVQIWKFVVALLGLAGAMPVLWSMLRQYQRERILVFLNPELDPSGAGYHVIQSQIALGSGGVHGKGLLNGSQCQLNFLPEKQTDFVFAALGEELGFIGCAALIALYVMLMTYNLGVAMRARDRFSQVLVFGINAMLFLYIFINISMVCGLLPVVGIPLPFFSYGGSALMVLLFCQGLIFAVDTEHKVKSGLNRPR
jgi:rod shape determining protein RodA